MESITKTQQVACIIGFTYKDESGNPQPTSVSSVAASVADPSIITLILPPAAPGPLSSYPVTLASTGVNGTTTLDVTATNADGSTVTGSVEVTVTDAAADAATFTFAAPTPLSVAVPPPSA